MNRKSSGMVGISHDKALVLAIQALANYADPSSYHGIALVADPTSGWFAEDFSFSKSYGRRVPGREARRALARIRRMVGGRTT